MKAILTQRQIEILRLRAKGYSQAEIARKLGTSRANISATEKTARKNIELAKNTVKLAKMIEAPIWIVIHPETDLDDAVKIIYKKADSENIRIRENFHSLANLIQSKVQEKIKGRRILAGIEVAIAEDGTVMVG